LLVVDAWVQRLVLVAAIGLACGVMFWTVRRQSQALMRALTVKRCTEQLAAQLSLEKTAADEARRIAEAANRAKTQFFSAASHDLRQPLHALGLFAETLRRKQAEAPVGQPAGLHDNEAAQLVHNIVESVGALEGLFDELLDLTHIDSGGVDVRPRACAMSEIYMRLRLHFEPVAFDKGLTLDFLGGHHGVWADPVLVERILRNLVSNAIRYTEDGGVIVSCRSRGGQRLLQVWDSGVGIAPEALSRIFDEFYQVSGRRRLETQHRKGMGLGLAIVKRLADLMGAPIVVRSQPERGSVFALSLPAAVAEPRRGGPAIVPELPQVTLHGRQVVVVEDDAAVLLGLRGLLESWGAQVTAFDCAQSVCDWAWQRSGPAPDLLIVDHGLPEQRTGTEVIAALREVWGPGLPAIMITGHTLHDHEAEARAGKYHVLFKPVAPNRLRAMVSFKLRSRAG
jgi:signal transduction histidine kinase/CheY-like chemotaxis protein